MKTLLLLAALLPSLASAQTIIECVVAVPDSVKAKDPKDATKPSADAVEAYKIVTFQDEKDPKALAAKMGYDVVSCGSPTVTADKTPKITITAKAPPCICAPLGGKCMYKPKLIDGKLGPETAAPQNLSFQAGELTGCTPQPKVCVELFGKTSMPDACLTQAAKDAKDAGKVPK